MKYFYLATNFLILAASLVGIFFASRQIHRGQSNAFFNATGCLLLLVASFILICVDLLELSISRFIEAQTFFMALSAMSTLAILLLIAGASWNTSDNNKSQWSWELTLLAMAMGSFLFPPLGLLTWFMSSQHLERLRGQSESTATEPVALRTLPLWQTRAAYWLSALTSIVTAFFLILVFMSIGLHFGWIPQQ